MRLFRNIILITVPLMLMINLYVYIFGTYNEVTYEFRGISYVYNYLGTFPGLDLFYSGLDSIQRGFTQLRDIDFNDIGDVFNAVSKIVSVFGLIIAEPILFIIDLFQIVIWFIGIWR